MAQVGLENIDNSIIEFCQTITIGNGYKTNAGLHVLDSQVGIDPPLGQRIIITYSEMQLIPEQSRMGFMAAFIPCEFMLQDVIADNDKMIKTPLELQREKKYLHRCLFQDFVTAVNNSFETFQPTLASNPQQTFLAKDYYRIRTDSISGFPNSEHDYISAIIGCQIIFFWDANTGNIQSGLV